MKFIVIYIWMFHFKFYLYISDSYMNFQKFANSEAHVDMVQ